MPIQTTPSVISKVPVQLTVAEVEQLLPILLSAATAAHAHARRTTSAALRASSRQDAEAAQACYDRLIRQLYRQPPAAAPAVAPTTTSAPPSARVRVTLDCQECGQVFRVSPNSVDIGCPKCGGVDYEVRA